MTTDRKTTPEDGDVQDVVERPLAPPGKVPQAPRPRTPAPPRTPAAVPEVEKAGDGLIRIDDLRIPQGFSSTGDSKTLSTPVRVRKPEKHQFFQAHKEPSYRLQTKMLTLTDPDREYYLVDKSVWERLEGEAGFEPFEIALCVDRLNLTPFLWPVRLPR